MSLPGSTKVQCFRVALEPDPEVILLALHPFVIAGLVPDRLDIRREKSAGIDALSLTAHFGELDDAQALELVVRVLNTPKVRTATLETIIGKVLPSSCGV